MILATSAYTATIFLEDIAVGCYTIFNNVCNATFGGNIEDAPKGDGISLEKHGYVIKALLPIVVI
jgi:hypothetical protein